MIIGILKEVKNSEFRASITPGDIHRLIEDSNKAYVRKSAGITYYPEIHHGGSDILYKEHQRYLQESGGRCWNDR